jgi:rod shape-determining protein MreD
MLQTTTLHWFSIGSVVPDLMLLLVVCWGLLRSLQDGLTWALLGGIILDLLSGGPFGATAICLAVACAVTRAGTMSISRDSPWLLASAGLLATAVYDAAYLALLRLTGHPIPWSEGLLQVLIPCMVLNALAMYPVWWVMRWVHRRTVVEQMG